MRVQPVHVFPEEEGQRPGLAVDGAASAQEAGITFAAKKPIIAVLVIVRIMIVEVKIVAKSESKDFVSDLWRDGFEEWAVGLEHGGLGENLDVDWNGFSRATGVGLG